MRDKKIDIVRGIAIVLMVIGHSGCPLKKFIYLFHMAVFFMISGYLFIPKYEKGLNGIVEYILRKLKGIWLPYFVWTIIYTLLNNVFLLVNIYSSKEAFVLGEAVAAHARMSVTDMLKNIVKAIFMSGRTEMGGAFWFLRTLFCLSCFFYIAGYILWKVIKSDRARDVVNLLMAFLFLFVGYVMHLKGIQTFGIPIVFSTYVLFLIGHLIRKYSLLERMMNLKSFFVSLFILVLACFRGAPISLGDNNFGNPIYMLIMSLAGWILCYYIAANFEKCFCGNGFAKLGKHTMSIVILHFLCFKLIHLLQIFIYNYPIEYLAKFPYLNGNGAWWVMYAFVGVLVPIVLGFIYRKVINFIRQPKRINIMI